IAQGRGANRPTPLTPVASPLPTPISLPAEHAPRRSTGVSQLRIPLLASLLLACTAGAFILLPGDGDTALPSGSSARIEKKKAPAAPATPAAAVHQSPQNPSANDNARRVALRSDDDALFQAAFADLAQIPANGAAIAESIVIEYGDTLASSAPREKRSRALGRLIWMAKAGSEPAAQRVAAFEKAYDAAKENVAKSAWWVRGEGPAPAEAVSWMENGVLLAEHGDRPAMLDVAFAIGHGRGLRQDRAKSVEAYLQAMAQSAAGDEFSIRIRQSGARGLTVVLNAIVEQKDQDAAVRLVPALQSNADSGAAGMQYYLGLFNECVARPANLDAARQWYRKAASDPEWKGTVERKARLLGKWCPRPARA
ncbi:MAG: hypothetical protein ACREVG_01605, partial [Burkholderiales bacterium]